MKNKAKFAFLGSVTALSIAPLSCTPFFNQNQQVSFQNQNYNDDWTNGAHDGVANVDTNNSVAANYKIDITATDLRNFAEFRVRDFYQEAEKFQKLKQIIKEHPDILFDWSSDNHRSIKDIWINTENDTTLMSIGAAQMERRINKDLNGRLYISVVIEERDVNDNLLPPKPPFNFILCGFKRDSNAFLSYNSESNKISLAIYNSILYGTKIKLNENSPLKNTEFILGNLFYYKDYSHATKSNLTPITPNFIIQGQDLIKVRTETTIGNDKIIFPPECLVKGEDNVEVKFWSDRSSKNLWKPLIVTLGVVCVPLIVLCFILILRLRNKRRQKI